MLAVVGNMQSMMIRTPLQQVGCFFGFGERVRQRTTQVSRARLFPESVARRSL